MILEVREIHKRFGGVQALRGVSFRLNREEILGLIGPNGSGKTTIFNVVTGQYRPESGRVIYDGRDITSFTIHHIARLGISRTFQASRLFFNLTVEDNLRIVCEVGLKPSKVSSRISGILEMVDLVGMERRLASELTSAQQRVLMIGLGASLSPSVLLLDEPTAGMNAEEVSNTLAVIKGIAARGCGVLLIEHNMRAVSDICHRCVVLNYGEVIAEGAMEDIKREPKVIKAYLGED